MFERFVKFILAEEKYDTAIFWSRKYVGGDLQTASMQVWNVWKRMVGDACVSDWVIEYTYRTFH